MSDLPEMNSLSRFRKQAGRLVLEAQGSCEVPAGCGGVVLRWRNPLSAVPVTVHLYTPQPATCYFDAQESRLGRFDLTPGRHAFALMLDNVDLSRGLILFVAIHKLLPAEPKSQPRVTELPFQVLTVNDGTWKCTLAEPSTDDWRRTAFDDRDWLVLLETESPKLERAATGYYQCQACVEAGAVCLGLPGKKSTSWLEWLSGGSLPAPPVIGRVWIRKEFEIPLPEFHES